MKTIFRIILILSLTINGFFLFNASSSGDNNLYLGTSVVITDDGTNIKFVSAGTTKFILTKSSANLTLGSTAGTGTGAIFNSATYTNALNVNNGFTSGSSTVNIIGSVDINGTSSYLLLPQMTTTQRDHLNSNTPLESMLINNTTVHKIQAYLNGAWVDLN